MKNINTILTNLLILDKNETYSLSNSEYNKFKTIILEILKIKYDIRFCSNNDCSCHPKKIIKDILSNDDKLVQFLKINKLYDDIIYIIATSNQTKINKYIFGEE